MFCDTGNYQLTLISTIQMNIHAGAKVTFINPEPVVRKSNSTVLEAATKKKF